MKINLQELRRLERKLDLKPILDTASVQYIENQTHFILKSCPTCAGRNKLYVDKKSKLWVCFKCVKTDDWQVKEGRGNILTLMKMIGYSSQEVEMMLASGALVTYTDPDSFSEMGPDEQSKEVPVIRLPSSFDKLDGTPQSVSKHFEAYKYMVSRHIQDTRVMKQFDLRYSAEMKRLIFPVYNDDKQPVGWQGRDITDRWKQDQWKCSDSNCSLQFEWYFVGEVAIPTNCPQCYSVLEAHHYPKSRNSKDFPKSQLFFNQHNVNWNERVSIVEGPFDCINTPNSIGLLGKVLSQAQLNILLTRAKILTIYLDGDDAGRMSTESLVTSLAPFFDELKVCPLPEGDDPGSHSIADNAKYLDEKSITAGAWMRQFAKHAI